MDIFDFPKITVILRGYTYSQVRCVVEALADTRLRAVEITMNSEGALYTIEKISQEFGKDILVGAGTVLTIKQAVDAIEHGARFLLAPVMLSPDILALCKENGVVSVPGAFSPSEVVKSFQDGASIVKVFPASTLGAKFFTDITAPLGRLPLMAVGGVNGDNVREYFDAGAMFAGIGSGIFKKEDILQENKKGLKESIQIFTEKCHLK